MVLSLFRRVFRITPDGSLASRPPRILPVLLLVQARGITLQARFSNVLRAHELGGAVQRGLSTLEKNLVIPTPSMGK